MQEKYEQYKSLDEWLVWRNFKQAVFLFDNIHRLQAENSVPLQS
ncbi:hypothetical protein [Hungatella hathewayi]|nr:hypothetical protein [Hungatella hathewayi]